MLSRVEAARPKWIPATVLLREIREQGYWGNDDCGARWPIDYGVP
jgi:hypothetical protein